MQGPGLRQAAPCSVDMSVRGGVSEGVAAGVVEQEASPGGTWRACIEGVGGNRYAALLDPPPPVVPPVCAVVPPAVARRIHLLHQLHARAAPASCKISL